MKTRPTHTPARRALLAALALLCALAAPAAAQTPGSTVISNTATATYQDVSSNNYSTTSNTVTVTVANVSGLVILPDAQTNSGVVPGQTAVGFVFTVTNTGNFSDQVRFLASGASVTLSGPATVTAAVIDNGDNTIGGGDIDILSNAGNVDHALAQGVSAAILVAVSINPGATAGQTVQVTLGDAATGGPTFDNQAANSSANEVRTVTATSVNGVREARGDISVTVQDDARLRAILSAPAGPVALGSDITYTASLCNDGARPAASMSLGANSGVYIVVPVPAGTAVSAANSFPAGTLYTTSLLTTAPQAATWQTGAVPANATRVAFRVGATLAASGACSGNFQLIVTVTAANATTPIYGIADAFANNSIGTTINDQSGDADTNEGDFNADFDEPVQGDPDVLGKGFRIRTLLQQLGGVLLGPQGSPGATGPTDQDDDFTERSVNTGIAGVAPGGTTTADGTVVFVNTLQNTGNANDTFTLSAPTVPANFVVEISTAGAAGPWTDVTSGGSTTLAVNFGQSADIHVRVRALSGRAILTGFSSVIQAASGITPANTNRTVDRLYTGFVRLTKTATVTNGTGVGAPNDPVPGAEIEFVVAYANIMTAVAAGSGNSSLAATNLVITENGATGGNTWGLPAPNNWTTQVVGSASDVNTTGTPGTITGDAAGSNVLTDTITSLPAGGSGTFRFKRLIRAN